MIGAETLSRIIDPHDRGTCILFGDGAAAVVLAPTTDDGPGHPRRGTLGCDGSATGLLEIPAGGSRLPATPETIADGDCSTSRCRARRCSAGRCAPSSSRPTLALDRAGVTVDDIDWFVPHQANLRIIEAAASRLGHPAASGRS